MSYTLGGITTKVQQRIRDTGYPSSEIHDYINDTQRDVFNEYRLPFMQTSQAYTVTIGASDITNGAGLPANFSQAIDLTYTSSGEKTIPYRELSDIDADADDTTAHPAGQPQYWYKFGNTIRVFPVPSTAYTVNLRYYKTATELTADADVPEIPSSFEEILVVGAAYRVMQVKDNYDQAGVLENKYAELLQKLVMRSSQAQTGYPTVMRINRHAMGPSHF